jgi:outer membrane receptor protein involved in Fe transport
MRESLLVVFMLTAFSAIVPLPVFAQATGTIAGIVTDETGAVIPGVTIEVTNVGTAQTRTAVTGADGYYSVPLLQPGPYQVKAALPGFKSLIRDGVSVTVESTSRVDMRLAVGRIEENVTVSGESPLVETSNATLGIVVDEKKIVDLPLNGRNFTQLGTLLPGVFAPPAALGGGGGDATPGGFGATTSGFSVNGMRNQSNNFLLDGTSNNDTFNTGFVLRPPPDAIQEFKILTHSYSAEYGRNSGSVVNVVTRAGTNELHGAAWEFNRDDALQARNFFALATQPKPKLKQNQFGASLGGPIARNRLFAFGYYEGHRNTSGTTTNIVVLTDDQRNGNFGSTVIRDPATGLPFENNTIPAALIDPTARRLVDEFVPRANSGTNRYIDSPDSDDNRDQMGIRGDYQLTPNHSMLVRYLRSRTEATTPPTTRPIGGVSTATLQDVMFSDTHIFSQHAINVGRFSYNRIAANPAVTSGLSNSDYGINVPQNVPQAAGLANIMVTGFFSLGDAQQPFVDRKNEVFQFTDDFTWVTGRHSMKFGVDIRKEHMVIAFVNRPNGDFTFTGSTTARTGNAAADFLLGLPAQFRRTTKNTTQDGTGWLYSAYAQDEFRPWPRITLNVGLRYELPIPFEDANGALNAFRPGQQSQRFPTAPTGLVYPGDPGIPDGTYATDKNNFAPRVGVVWDPMGSGRSSLRAAWGIFYDALAGQGDFFQNGVLAPPFTPLLEVNAPPAPLTLRNPLTAVSGGAADFPPGLIFIGWGEDFTSPYAHHFNVTWQQQIGSLFAAEGGYVGSRGYHLPIFMEVNPGLYVPGQTSPGARLFPAFSLVRPTFSVARSWYDSLQASFRMRPAHGMYFLASYTLGHAVDHVSGLNIGGEQRPVLPVTIGDNASIEQALTFEKGDALFDVRHRFVLSFGAELPTPTDYGALLRHLAGGWQANGIVQWQTGFPTGVYDPTTDIRYLTNRPDVTCDPNDNAPHTIEQWFNTSCFVRRAVPDTGTRPGNAGRNTVRGPGFARTDLSFFKNIDLGRSHRVQFRAEAFNLFNQTRFAQPGNQIGTVNFGRITSADDGRIIQLAVKYNF